MLAFFFIKTFSEKIKTVVSLQSAVNAVACQHSEQPPLLHAPSALGFLTSDMNKYLIKIPQNHLPSESPPYRKNASETKERDTLITLITLIALIALVTLVTLIRNYCIIIGKLWFSFILGIWILTETTFSFLFFSLEQLVSYHEY